MELLIQKKNRVKAPQDLIGRKFGKLTVLTKAPRVASKSGYYTPKWTCLCDCGNKIDTRTDRLVKGKVRSCGCYRRTEYIPPQLTHGKSNSSTYISWQSMKKRCDDVNHDNYLRYGGRGISYCKEWAKFEAFLEDMGERPQGCTLDRINPNGNYNKANCRWANAKDQSNNRNTPSKIRSDAKTITFKGEEITVVALAKLHGLNLSCLKSRLKKMSVEEALEKPVQKRITRT